jgi:prepilin signal peptidase PulO-like enzyme (type II secretory pathway)
MFAHADFFGLLISLIMGLGWGSFATMAVYRLPRGMPWICDQPRCFMCKHELNIIDYFSIISYFVWNGTCRYCKGKYECSIGYLLTELFITIGILLCYMKYGFGDIFVLVTLLVVACTIMAVVDAEHKRIPAKILISTLFIGTVLRVFLDQTFYGALYGGITAGVIGLGIRHVYFIIKGQKEVGYDYTQWKHEDRFAGEGFDYVKLLAIVGVFLPLVHFGAYLINIGSLSLLWYVVHPKSFRLGAIMAAGLAAYVIYPEVIDSSLKILLGF